MVFPYLKDIGDSKQLYVHDEPYLILGAEIHNSTASNIEFMEPTLAKLVDLNINTVFLPIAWEQIEQQEGVFDFSHLDAILQRLRFHKLKVGLLWFGSFKNGESAYVPLWVKKDTTRFPRSVTQKEGKLTVTKTLSVFVKENIEYDKRAFVKLMEHLIKVDGKQNTVVMVQVQNESGVLWDVRDRSPIANKYFQDKVPSELLSAVKNAQKLGTLSTKFTHRFPEIKDVSGSWEDVFGPGEATEEVFMAWHYARYIDKIAEAGKAVYSLPMFINVALCTPESNPRAAWKHPGQYPSGGVVAHLMDIYRFGAPSIDVFAPDIYDVKFEECCEAYRHGNNPLLIPEMRRDVFAAERVFYAYGACKAIGLSPFGIDSQYEKSTLFKSHYDILKQISPYVLQGQAQGKIAGFHFSNEEATSVKTFKFGSITAYVERAGSPGKPQTGFGLIIQTGEYEFLGAGFGFTVMFSHDSNKRVEIMQIREGQFIDGKWKETRWMNGDESASNQRWIHAVVEPDYGDYHVPFIYPANTGITKCEVFVHPGELYGMYPLFDSNYIV